MRTFTWFSVLCFGALLLMLNVNCEENATSLYNLRGEYDGEYDNEDENYHSTVNNDEYETPEQYQVKSLPAYNPEYSKPYQPPSDYQPPSSGYSDYQPSAPTSYAYEKSPSYSAPASPPASYDSKPSATYQPAKPETYNAPPPKSYSSPEYEAKPSPKYQPPASSSSYAASNPAQKPDYKPESASSKPYATPATPKYSPSSVQSAPYKPSYSTSNSYPKPGFAPAAAYNPKQSTRPQVYGPAYKPIVKQPSPYDTSPNTYSPESFGGPMVYQGQKYEGQISLYKSYLSSNSYNVYNQKCAKLYGQTPRISNKDLDQAFAYAYDEVKNYDGLEKALYRNGKYLNISSAYSSSIRHQLPTYISTLSPEYFKEREALLMEFATKYLVKNNCLSRLDASLMLPQVQIKNRPLKEYTCNYLHSHNAGAKTINCTQFVHSPYSTFDGRCNNLYHPYWGKAKVCHLRLVASAYDDGVSAPRQASFRYGAKLPDPRTVSQAAHPDISGNGFYTHMVMAWGQYVNHDITFTPKSQPQYKEVVMNCCPNGNSTQTAFHPQCYPVKFAPNDQMYQKYGKSCLNFVRSAPCPLCSLGPRQQMNLVTSFLDLSLAYGNNRKESNELRTFKNGQLAAGVDRYGRETLPPSGNGRTDQCSSNRSGHCYKAGDNRVNQYPGLTALHTISQRLHNQHARALQRVNPHWSDERLFLEARRINIAGFQHITYEEYLPLVFGPTLAAYFNLQSPARSYRGYYGPAYTTYEPYTDPTTWNDYAAAACRYGHSQIGGFFSLIHKFTYSPKTHAYSNITEQRGGFWLRDEFFNPHLMSGGYLDSIIRGLVTDRSQVVDPFASEDIKNHLYQSRGEKIGSDLIAFNIQRGRDHGLPAYHVYLDFCFGVKVHGWQDLARFIPTQQLNVLRSLYPDFRDIDLYTGGLSEKKFPDASVGPTFACILGIQYYHLKFGDRYFYSHGQQAGSFTPAQLSSIQNSLTLSNYLCKSSDYLGEVQKKPFLPISSYNPLVKCSSLPDLDYSLWKEKY